MREALDLLRRAERVAIVSHRDPDADTIGAGATLGLALDALGKRVSLHCADPVPEALRQLLPSTARYQSSSPPGDVDLVVTVDFGDASRAKIELPVGPPLLNIDHHVTNVGFGRVNVVDVQSAATAEIVARIVDELGVPWSTEMATAALVGIMTDTGSFQFPNTDARALQRAAMLRAAGADLTGITYEIFRNRRFEALQLWGHAFARLEREDSGRLVWTWIGRDDMTRTDAIDEDVSGLVEQVARSRGMRVTLLFNATSPGEVKVSCRTSPREPTVDAAELMARFGGGGHARAAGALVPGTLADVRERVLREARTALTVSAPPVRP